MFLPLILLLINSYDIVPSMIFSVIYLVRFLFYHHTVRTNNVFSYESNEVIELSFFLDEHDCTSE